MTSAASKIADTVFPGAGSVGKKAGDEIAEELIPTPGGEDTPAELAPRSPRIEARTEEFETRAQKLGRQAAAGGATRSGNDADMLGYVTPKRKGAARRTLGGA